MRLRNTLKGLELLQLALASGFHPNDEIQTYQCARAIENDDRRLCNHIFPIRVKDWIVVEVS